MSFKIHESVNTPLVTMGVTLVLGHAMKIYQVNKSLVLMQLLLLGHFIITICC